MKIKVLGSSAPYCKDERNCSGYLITNNNTKILLDAGFGITRNMKFPEDLNNLNIIISHLHKDHYAELFAIHYSCIVYNAHNKFDGVVNVYIPTVKETDKEYLDYLIIKKLQSNVFNIIEYDRSINGTYIDDVRLDVMKNYHGDMNSYSIKLTSDKIITYSGDMSKRSINDLTLFSKDSNVLIIEASLLKDDVQIDNHLSTIEAANVGINSNSKLIVFTHMFPETNKDKYVKEVKDISQNTIYASENDVIEV